MHFYCGMKIVFATDVHGNAESYERLLKEAERKEIGAVVIGGDITPFGGFNAIVTQRAFLEDYFVPRLERFRKNTKKPVFVMMGNDDFSINIDVLEKAEVHGILRIMHNKVLPLGKFSIAGYSFIPPTPFMIKDWERDEDEIAADLKILSSKSEPKKTLFVFHAPPAETGLDMLYNGAHMGSAAVLGFIKQKQPLVTLHGHIHESPEMSGSWKQKTGKTVSINPGSNAFVVVDLEKPESSAIRKYRSSPQES